MSMETTLGDTPASSLAASAAHISPAAASTIRSLVLEPPGRWPELGLAELWAYRSLFFFLVWSGIKSR